ncbi:hypothetical protein HYDPIDRAFT_105347 [Hydnomerulius pinastri MD-312]|nr:hypothetical protein HYDPIDRAFT_105347 [Hydnomerulius pinastri MD-312]
MVFTRLSAQEKEAFFGLLDEYFQARPELFGNGEGGSGASGGEAGYISTGAAASAVHRALAANPEATSKIVSAGLTHGMARSNNPYAAAAANNPDISNSVGRVAAASLAFSGGGGGAGAIPAPNTPPPTLPRRTPSTMSTSSSQERVALPGSEVDKLITKKGSVFSSFKKSPTVPMAPIPPAFPPPRNNFGPPPVRRTTSETSSGGTSSAPTLPRRQVPVVQEPEPEEPQGEWGEVLYDYSSEDPGDLAIEAGSRVLVTAKSSDDWWTGQIDGEGKEGLFPASYVKLL